MQHAQTVLMVPLEVHSNEPEVKEVSDALCVAVARSDSFSSEEETPAESRDWRPSVAVPKPADEVTHEVMNDLQGDRPPSASVTQLGPLASGMGNEYGNHQRTLNYVLQLNRLSVPAP